MEEDSQEKNMQLAKDIKYFWQNLSDSHYFDEEKAKKLIKLLYKLERLPEPEIIISESPNSMEKDLREYIAKTGRIPFEFVVNMSFQQEREILININIKIVNKVRDLFDLIKKKKLFLFWKPFRN